MVYIDDYKCYYYLILADFMIVYKDQILITGIKTNIQYLIYYILLKKKDSRTQLWDL